jgi:DNA-binding XRE family transcriptional regulator
LCVKGNISISDNKCKKEVKMSFGTRFREFRKELKKTQQFIAERLGCTQSNINMYEKDEISPP